MPSASLTGCSIMPRCPLMSGGHEAMISSNALPDHPATNSGIIRSGIKVEKKGTKVIKIRTTSIMM